MKEIDLEKLAEKTFPKHELLNDHDWYNLKDGFVEGYKAKESEIQQPENNLKKENQRLKEQVRDLQGYCGKANFRMPKRRGADLFPKRINEND